MTFKDLLKGWETEVQALRTTLPMSYLITSAFHSQYMKELKQFINNNCAITDKKNEDDFEYTVPPEVYNSYNKISKKIDRLDVARKLIPRMFLITLICQYDALIGNLARLILNIKPEILNNSERQLSFKEIVDFGTLEKAKEYIISKEIETLLRKSHKEQIIWFEKKLEINLQSDKQLLENFYEITERRNLFTHNNGIVNESYISNCKQLGCKISVNLGDELDITEHYFSNSVNCLFEIGIKLTTTIWRILCPNENQDSEIAINNIAFNLISEDNYDLAIKMLNFPINYFHNMTNANKLMLNINLAQCYLWKKDNIKCKKIIDEQDWSMCTADYKVCKAVLEQDFKTAVNILKNENTGIQQNDLLEWPIFKELRKEKVFTDYFSTKYSITVDEYKKSFKYREDNKKVDNTQKNPRGVAGVSPAERVAENAAGGWSEGETSPS